MYIPGPKTNSVEMITQLRNAGLNVVRMNFSHGSYEVSLFFCFHGIVRYFTDFCKQTFFPFLVSQYHQSVIENTRKSFERKLSIHNIYHY